MILQRRKFITGLASLIAAPAIVKASSLMPIRGVPLNNSYMKMITDYHDDLFIKRDFVIEYRYMYIQPEWVLNLG